MDNERKALPNLPSLNYDSTPKTRRHGQLTRLTVEGRAHQKKFIKYALQETIFQVDEFQVLGVGTLELEGAGQILLSSNEESPGFLLLGADSHPGSRD